MKFLKTADSHFGGSPADGFSSSRLCNLLHGLALHIQQVASVMFFDARYN
jgi:hypothetical protein